MTLLEKAAVIQQYMYENKWYWGQSSLPPTKREILKTIEELSPFVEHTKREGDTSKTTLGGFHIEKGVMTFRKSIINGEVVENTDNAEILVTI